MGKFNTGRRQPSEAKALSLGETTIRMYYILIKSQAECDIALVRVYKLMQENITPNSKESEELETLSILIKEFESKAYKLE